MAEAERTYRQERFTWQGDVYWQRVRPPWRVVTTLRGVNVSRSGLLAEGDEQALRDVFAASDTILQLNGDDCYPVLAAVCVRRQGQQVAFSFTAPNDELQQLLAQINAEAQ